MKLKYILSIITICCLKSCTPDPSYQTLESYNFYYENSQAARLQAGESTGVVLNYQVNSNTQAKIDSIRIEFEPIAGDGLITPEADYLTPGNNTEAIWQLGTGSTQQVLRATAYDLSGNYLTYVDQVAYGFRDNEWDKIEEIPDNRITDLVADTMYNLTFMIAYSTLYKQGENYYLWEEVDDSILKSYGGQRTVEIDSAGVIYVSTWSGELLKSIDHGVLWSVCTKPYPDLNHYIHIYISNDNSMWVYTQGFPIKRSEDGGITWTEIGGGITGGVFGDVFRLNNGYLLYHGSDCCSLQISYDDGLSWNHLTTPGYSIKLFVDDNDEIILITQLNGLEFYHSTDFGTTFNYIHRVSPQFVTSMVKTFNRWKDFYYVFIPGYGILKTDDLINYENCWRKPDFRELFIDHNGVLIAKDQDFKTVYYLHITE